MVNPNSKTEFATENLRESNIYMSMVQSTNFGTAQNNLENLRQDRKMMQEFSD